MNKFLTLISFFMLCSAGIQAQIIFEEDFEGGSLPAGWTIETNATDGGWNVGSAATIGSQFFDVPSNGSSNIIGTNDDACDCDKSDEYLITPSMDFSGETTISLVFDAFYLDNFYGYQEDATIEVSTNGTDWDVLLDLPGEAAWVTYTIDLSAYAGEETIYIGFHYDDGTGWLYGFGLDNVVVQVPFSLDAKLVDIDSRIFGEIGTGLPIKGELYNEGVDEITEVEISYSVDGGSLISETLSGLNIPSFSFYEFETTTPWVPVSAGIFTIDVEISSVNGISDENPDNNAGFFEPEIFDLVVVPNKIDDFIGASSVFTEITGASNFLDKPTDLEFFPILGKDELWVVNQRVENSGGSTLTIADATQASPSDYDERVDGNSWHFMSLPTGIAFSDDNFNFATSPGVQDANHGGGTFTGPTLWSSDPDIYAQPSGGNGSHLDMLHGSPFSMGIAHEVDNVFWVYDDWNTDIVRYDFVDDHGPGNDYHSDAIVRRYQNIGIGADGDVPNHMVIDKSSGWLYFVDNGNNRVVRLDIYSGSVTNTIPLINEALAEHSAMGGYTTETIVTGLDTPCGIEVFENRLLVGEYDTGEIIIYDLDNDFDELGRIQTLEPGLTGIKVGPDGNIWFTNRLQNTLKYAEPGEPTSIAQTEQQIQVLVSPNPTSDLIWVNMPELADNDQGTIWISNATGQQLITKKGLNKSQQLDLSGLPNGVYLLKVQGETFSHTQKIIVSQ